MLKSSENSATIIKSKGMAKDMTYQTCVKVIARVKGEEYLENLIKGARELSEFSIVDPYDEIYWKERTLMPLLRKEAKEALGIVLPMNIRVIRMRRIIGDPSASNVWQKLLVVAAHLIFRCSDTQRYGNRVKSFQDIDQNSSDLLPSLAGLEQVRFLLWILIRNLILGS